MLKDALRVRDAILAASGDGYASLQTITQIVSGVTAIDQVRFTSYDVPVDNPILGSFRRFERRLAAYEPVSTIVEVRYASHIPEPMRRFVVCKELCHALEADNGAHHVSDREIENLVETFSLTSNSDITGPIPETFRLEQMAEVCSIEILCPLQRRKEILASGQFVAAAVADQFNIPVMYAGLAFRPAYIEWVEATIEGL